MIHLKTVFLYIAEGGEWWGQTNKLAQTPWGDNRPRMQSKD